MAEKRKKKRRLVLWATAVVLLAYPLSFGPACWLGGRQGRIVAVSRVYFPIGWVAVHTWEPVRMLVRCYARLGLSREVHVAVPTDPKRGGGLLVL